jgi:hypothetical protein
MFMISPWSCDYGFYGAFILWDGERIGKRRGNIWTPPLAAIR